MPKTEIRWKWTHFKVNGLVTRLEALPSSCPQGITGIRPDTHLLLERHLKHFIIFMLDSQSDGILDNPRSQHLYVPK
jgi:hypothetical protein